MGMSCPSWLVFFNKKSVDVGPAFFASKISLNLVFVLLFQVPHFFEKMQKDLDVNIGTIRFFKFTIYIALLSHWSSCLWYLFACPDGK